MKSSSRKTPLNSGFRRFGLPKIKGDDQSQEALNPPGGLGTLGTSSPLLCCSIKKSFCSPLNGDFELCQEVGEQLTSTVDSLAFLSVSLRSFVSSAGFTTGLETFALPLAGMRMQPRWKQMSERCQKLQKKGERSPEGHHGRVVPLTGWRGPLSWGSRPG